MKAFRLGLVGLCTSHPESWVPIIRDMNAAGLCNIELAAVWDSGETRPEGFARDFAQRFDIPLALDRLEDMVDKVDGVIVHTTNWDKHLEQAKSFIQAGKPVLLDKPVVGNLRELFDVLDLRKQGVRVLGGSSLRFCREAKEFLALPEAERGAIDTVYTSIGVDDYNYGIHGYALMMSFMEEPALSVRFLGASAKKQLMIRFTSGRIGLMTMGPGVWLPFDATVITSRMTRQIHVDGTQIYRSLLEASLPYLTGAVDTPPVPDALWLEPEKMALAAKKSWMLGGAEVFLSDLSLDDEGYDGTAFAREYRRARLG